MTDFIYSKYEDDEAVDTYAKDFRAMPQVPPKPDNASEMVKDAVAKQTEKLAKNKFHYPCVDSTTIFTDETVRTSDGDEIHCFANFKYCATDTTVMLTEYKNPQDNLHRVAWQLAELDGTVYMVDVDEGEPAFLYWFLKNDEWNLTWQRSLSDLRSPRANHE